MPAHERNAADALENVQDPSCGIEGRGKACWLTPALVHTDDDKRMCRGGHHQPCPSSIAAQRLSS